MLTRDSLKNKKIVVFDGDCAFCNRSVIFIRNKNRKENILFCPSQSETAKNIISEFNITESPQNTLIYIKDSSAHYYSSAAIHITKELSGLWPILQVFLIVPKFIRNAIYKFIAKNRKRIPGKKYACSLDEAPKFKGRLLK